MGTETATTPAPMVSEVATPARMSRLENSAPNQSQVNPRQGEIVGKEFALKAEADMMISGPNSQAKKRRM